MSHDETVWLVAKTMFVVCVLIICYYSYLEHDENDVNGVGRDDN